MLFILAFVTFGNRAVERLFAHVSWLLYGVYALFVIIAFIRFGGRISAGFAAPAPAPGWALGGLIYASYNLIGAIVILPMAITTLSRGLRGEYVRHVTLAKWTFPLWLYVSVTGVIVYLMLYRF